MIVCAFICVDIRGIVTTGQWFNVNVSLEVAQQHVFISATGWDRKAPRGVDVGSGE
jgi:hypothetical protein